MPYVRLVHHIIFATYCRRPELRQDIRNPLFGYMFGILRNLGARPVVINGFEDHVHTVLYHPAKVSTSDLLCQYKRNANTKANELLNGKFSGWQEGYAALSARHYDFDGLVAYVRNQEQHHKKESFVEEIVRLFQDEGMDEQARYFLKALGIDPDASAS